LLAATTGDGHAYLWNLRTGRLQTSIKAGSCPVLCSALSPNGSLIALATADGLLQLWSVRKATLYRQLPTVSSYSYNCIAFTPDGSSLVGADNRNSVRFWDIRSGQETLALHGHTGHVTALDIAEDGATLTTVGGDYVRRWSATPM
jgi:WD40 repeat protein